MEYRRALIYLASSFFLESLTVQRPLRARPPCFSCVRMWRVKWAALCVLGVASPSRSVGDTLPPFHLVSTGVKPSSRAEIGKLKTFFYEASGTHTWRNCTCKQPLCSAWQLQFWEELKARKERRCRGRPLAGEADPQLGAGAPLSCSAVGVAEEEGGKRAKVLRLGGPCAAALHPELLLNRRAGAATCVRADALAAPLPFLLPDPPLGNPCSCWGSLLWRCSGLCLLAWAELVTGLFICRPI